jgi:hypothetical protein
MGKALNPIFRNRVKCGGNRKGTRTTFMSPKEKAGEERIVDILSEPILK